jgi:hypothetical protein
MKNLQTLTIDLVWSVVKRRKNNTSVRRRTDSQ